MKKKHGWFGREFIKVSKKQYENFCRFFKNEIKYDAFMGWKDGYDWSLASEKYPAESYERIEECMVCRFYFEGPRPEFYIDLNYIKLKNYNLNTKVPKEKKEKPTKEEKKAAKILCDIFDEIYKREAYKRNMEENMKKLPRTKENTLKLLEITNLVTYTFKVDTDFAHKTFWSSEYLNDSEDREHFYNYNEEKDKYDLKQGVYCYYQDTYTMTMTLVGKITEKEVIIY